MEGGLARWDNAEWKVFTTRDGLSGNLVRAIAEDAQGNLWVGTDGGLNRWHDGKFTAVEKKHGLAVEHISSLWPDADGVLWVGTDGRGLARFHDGTWTNYTTQDGLISNSLGYIVEDGQGCLWIGSNAGLMRVPKNALNNFASGRTNFVPCRAYGSQDGLPTSECTSGSQPAASRTRDGRLWFPTIKGLASVDPARLHPNTNPPPVIIESVEIQGESQTTNTLRSSLPERITVPANREHLEIHYTSINLEAPRLRPGALKRARFKYRMENHETAWTDAGDSRTAPYSKLPPGDYTFRVKACNEDGIWNETGAWLAIKVLPPFWRQWWFLAGATLCMLGVIVSGVHYVSTQRLQRQLADLRQQQALEKERARIARDIHDQVGASLTQVSLLGEMVESDKDSPEEIEAHGRQISQTARETSRALDEIVWTVNPSNDTLEGLANYLCKYAQDYLTVAGLKYRLEEPPQLPATTISPEVRHNTFLAAKEAITNIVKHAHASAAWLRLRVEDSAFVLEIQDDGRGPGGAETKVMRNGLRNMRKRMEDIGGRFEMSAASEGGTLVRLTVPLGKRWIK
jgi:signal transduction histidine kinase